MKRKRRIDAGVPLEKKKNSVSILKDTCFFPESCGNNVSTKSACSPLAFLPQLWGTPPPSAGYSQWQAFLLLYFQMLKDTSTLPLKHPRTKRPRESSDWLLATQLVGDEEKQESCWQRGSFRGGEETDMTVRAVGNQWCGQLRRSEQEEFSKMIFQEEHFCCCIKSTVN